MGKCTCNEPSLVCAPWCESWNDKDKRIAELEGFNIGLANESHAQQKRIAKLEAAILNVLEYYPELTSLKEALEDKDD